MRPLGDRPGDHHAARRDLDDPGTRANVRAHPGIIWQAVRALPREKLWVKPYPYGNSVGHLVLHLTGNLNHYVGAKIAATGYIRDRPREFNDPAEPRRARPGELPRRRRAGVAHNPLARR